MQSGTYSDVTLVKLLLMITENVSESPHSEPEAKRNARQSYDDRAGDTRRVIDKRDITH